MRLVHRSMCQRKYDVAGFYPVFRMMDEKVSWDDKVSWLTERVVFLLILHHFDSLTKKQRHGICLIIALYYTHSSQSNSMLRPEDKTVASGQFPFHRKSRSPPVNGSFAGEEHPE